MRNPQDQDFLEAVTRCLLPALLALDELLRGRAETHHVGVVGVNETGRFTVQSDPDHAARAGVAGSLEFVPGVCHASSILRFHKITTPNTFVSDVTQGVPQGYGEQRQTFS